MTKNDNLPYIFQVGSLISNYINQGLVLRDTWLGNKWRLFCSQMSASCLHLFKMTNQFWCPLSSNRTFRVNQLDDPRTTYHTSFCLFVSIWNFQSFFFQHAIVNQNNLSPIIIVGVLMKQLFPMEEQVISVTLVVIFSYQNMMQ